MLRLNEQQRTELGETVREAANLIFGALVVGQALTPRPVSWSAIVAGMLIWIVLVSFALYLSGAR